MANDLLRASSVQRWHIVAGFRQQSLAEHQFNVAILAGRIAEMLCLPQYDISTIMRAALYHDIEEVITGDIAAPVKHKFNVTYKVGNQEHIPELWQKIIKGADYVDAMWFLGEFTCGSHARAVLDDVDRNYTKWFDEQEPVLQDALNDIMREVGSTRHVII